MRSYTVRGQTRVFSSSPRSDRVSTITSNPRWRSYQYTFSKSLCARTLIDNLISSPSTSVRSVWRWPAQGRESVDTGNGTEFNKAAGEAASSESRGAHRARIFRHGEPCRAFGRANRFSAFVPGRKTWHRRRWNSRLS